MVDLDLLKSAAADMVNDNRRIEHPRSVGPQHTLVILEDEAWTQMNEPAGRKLCALARSLEQAGINDAAEFADVVMAYRTLDRLVGEASRRLEQAS